VNDTFSPTLTLSRAQGGSSADLVAWAQAHQSAHWGVPGSGQPLHRRISYDGNRRIICKTDWTADAVMTAALQVAFNDKDTCDEFPFAGTYEAPGNPPATIASGAQCAQLTAVQLVQPTGADEAVDWPTVEPLGSSTGSEPCVRGHIPGNLNSSVGGSYGRFSQPDPPGVRLIDGDPFWVSVTA
jgi:hypothetical protein